METDQVQTRWVPVRGFENFYEVSDMGQVRRIGGQPLRPSFNQKTGYSAVVLYVNSQRSDRYVHRLVAEAFCYRRNGRHHVNHLNGDKLDNRAANLEWVTPKENHRHALMNNLRASTLKEADVCLCRNERRNGATYRSLAARFGVLPETVSEAVRGVTWAHLTSVPPFNKDAERVPFRRASFRMTIGGAA